MQVASIQNDYQINVTDMPIPALPPKGALIRVLGCGLCGSDLDKLVHKKASPGSVLGHEIVGVIEALDDEHPDGWQLGSRLVSAHHVPCGHCHYCLNDSESMCRQFKETNFHPGGFSQYLALSEQHLKSTAFKIPDAISNEEASCVEPLACVLRGVRRGGTQINGSVMVIGLGFIGLMAAQIYQNDGAAVYGVDLDPARNQLGMAEGFLMAAFHPVEQSEQLHDTLKRHTPTGKVDTVFLSVVNNTTLTLALDLVRDGGTMIVFTSGPAGTSIDPSRLYFREINLITTYSPALIDLKNAAHIIANRKINITPLISHRLPLQDIQQAVHLYQSGQAIKVFISMGDIR
ncbi:alcohol dehydrogenase catalytic domain-containing protein [Vampirovibrio sp.]|uniref:alcohol dehydrogenase catalytic domain-containing protein n=1 Tax=Vampirovibrio sp. TaxID=2717857 RepID=UPI00359434D0